MDTETQTETRTTAIARLLAEAGAAHGVFEATVLGGVHDAGWPAWYAAHLLGHGLADLLPAAGAAGVDRLGAALARLDADHRREAPEREWPAYYAERLAAVVG